MNVANANELRGVRGACRVPCACTATIVHVHGTVAHGTIPINVCQEQNNAKQLVRDWREIVRCPENCGRENLFSFVQQRQRRNLPWRGLADCRIRLRACGDPTSTVRLLSGSASRKRCTLAQQQSKAPAKPASIGSSRVAVQDVADALGISRGTVDRALNGRHGVNPETKLRVLRAAQKLGYRPNLAARYLSSSKP